MKDKYDKLRDKTKRIVKEGERILKAKEDYDDCKKKNGCAACLSARARGNVDEIDFKDDFGLFDSSEDVCMLDARDILKEKYNLG